MATKRRTAVRQKDNLLYESLQYVGMYDVPTEFELISYEKGTGKVVKSTDYDTIVRNLQSEGAKHWLSVRGLTDISRINGILQQFDVSVLWCQDILNGTHVAKIEIEHDSMLVIMDNFTVMSSEQLGKEHYAFLLMPNIVISFQETETDRFQTIRTALLEKKSKIQEHSSDYLLNLLLSNLVDGYLAMLDFHREKWLDIEDVLMDFQSNHQAFGKKIQSLRKNYLYMRRNMLPLQNQFQNIFEKESPLIADDTLPYFRDTNDHLNQVFQILDGLQGMITSVVDLYMATNDMRLNSVVGRLTILSAIFIPLTFLAGVWGMNFRIMPELDWNYGYFIALGSMLFVAVAVIIYFKIKKWI